MGFQSDQLVAHAAAPAQLVPTTQRARVTSIQAAGAATSTVILKSGGVSGTTIATYKFGTEGLSLLLPSSGILFDQGVYLDLTATPGVTITFT